MPPDGSRDFALDSKCCRLNRTYTRTCFVPFRHFRTFWRTPSVSVFTRKIVLLLYDREDHSEVGFGRDLCCLSDRSKLVSFTLK